MPVKRRIAKRRIQIPLDCWDMVFRSGYDFFSCLADYGINGDEQARAAAQDAWETLGASFMERWRSEGEKGLHWAAVTFGLPDAEATV